MGAHSYFQYLIVRSNALVGALPAPGDSSSIFGLRCPGSCSGFLEVRHMCNMME